MSTEATRPWRVAVDRGGTFTDVVATPRTGAVVIGKVPSGDLAALLAEIRSIVGWTGDEPITPDVVSTVRFGTTAATNALLTRRGEPTAFFVTAGFADLLEIGSQERPDLFSLRIDKPRPLPARVVEVAERVLADGRVRTPLDVDALRESAADAVAQGLRSAAVAFLHSYRNPVHERAARKILADAGFETVALSHVVANEIRILPRASTACADAYLTPVLRESLGKLRDAFTPSVDVRFMQSHGGLADLEHVSGPRAVLSGPAGGAVAVAEVAVRARESEVVGFDMGGTSTDVCRFAGELEHRYETRVAGHRLQIPTLDIVTVAAGGGSILAFDGRRLRVGPESAGSSPGPAGYGLGGPATLTDANATLGRLLPDVFPACFGPDGRSRFDVEASRQAVGALARRARLDREQAAMGFLRVAVERMAQAIREVSVGRGHDLRRHALVCFGGAAPQFACALARELGVRRVIVPVRSSVLSAWGIDRARPAFEGAAAVLAALDGPGLEAAHQAGRGLVARAHAELEAQGVDRAHVRIRRLVEVRYLGVDATVTAPLGDLAATRSAFEAAHHRLYGFARAGRPAEIVNVRVVAREDAPRAAPRPDEAPAPSGRGPEPGRFAEMWVNGPTGPVPGLAPVVPLSSLSPGHAVSGPALVVDPVTTVVVEPGWRLAMEDPETLCLLQDRTVLPPPITTARDPISLALLANRFMAVAQRMGAVLERVGHSTNIKERLDFSCAVFDSSGRLLANAPHIPVHLGAVGESVRAILAARGTDLREDDVILTNDPYHGGSHLPDITAVTPVWVEGGRARFFVANRAHHADVGGVTPGSMPPDSRTLEEEGVSIHDFLLVRDGRFDSAGIAAAFRSGPHPARSLGERAEDLRAQVAANREGARLLRTMCEELGPHVVCAFAGHVLDDGAEAMESLLESMPDGEHTFVDPLDDGTPIAVRITVAGHRAVVDWHGTGPRSEGNLNTPAAVVRAAVLFALRTLVRRPLPLNEGCLRPVELRIPADSLLDPRPPCAVVGGNVETSMRLVDVLLAALGACAGSQGTMNNVSFGPNDDGSGRETRSYYETLGGGSGAGPTFPGADAVHSHMTNTRLTDVEVLETRWPVVMRRTAVRRGSGGAGAHRGGDGMIREIEFLEAARGGILSERRVRGAFGLEGGGPGQPGCNVLIRGGEETPLPGRVTLDLLPGDVLRIETPGGGGYGTA